MNSKRMIGILLVCSLIFSQMLVPAFADTTNLIGDGIFTSGLEGWEKNYSNNISIGYSSDIGHDAPGSVKEVNNGGSEDVGVRKPIPDELKVSGHGVYTVTAWAYTEDIGVVIKPTLVLLKPDGSTEKYYYPSSAVSLTAGEWTKIERTFNVEEWSVTDLGEKSGLYMFVGYGSATSFTVYYDDVSLIKESTVEKNLITNGGFETGSYTEYFEENGTTVTVEQNTETGNHYAKMIRAAATAYWYCMRPKSDKLVEKYNTYGAGIYKYSAFYKTDSATGTYKLSPRVTVQFSDGTKIAPTADIMVNADGWESFELTFEIPSDKIVSAIYIGQYTPIDKTKDYVLYIDDMKLVKIAEPSIPEDLQKLTILATTPVNGATNVSVNDVVVLTFSHALDTVTTNTISVTCDGETVPSTVSVEGASVTVDFEKNYGALYTVTVPLTVTSEDGVTMENEYTFTFTTESFTAPDEDENVIFDSAKDIITNGDFEDDDVTSYFEANGSEYNRLVDDEGNHYIQMTKAAGVNYWQSFRPIGNKLAAKLIEYGPGTYRYSGRYKSLGNDYNVGLNVTIHTATNTSFVKQSADLPIVYGEWKKFNLDIVIPDWGNDTPTALYISQYTPNTAGEYKLCLDDLKLEKVEGLKVRNIVTPNGNFSEVPVDASLEIEFSNPVVQSTISNLTLQRAGNVIECKKQLSDDGYTCILTPFSDLEKGTEYTLVIAETLTDTYGNAAENAEYTFKTVNPDFNISVLSVTSTDGTALPSVLSKDDTVQVNVIYSNLTDTAQPMTIILSEYADNEFKGFVYLSKDAQPGRVNQKVIMQYSVKNDESTVKAMVWDTFVNIKPLYKKIIN